MSLRKSTLEKIWLWAEANPKNSLVEAYFGACDALASIDIERLQKLYGFKFSAGIENSAFDLRDAIGTRLLKEINSAIKNTKKIEGTSS